ncbi:MAG TPA: FKBP-type peptidyl-prolyl cis-trans isomerase [bacterium]|nr:FKBP-type peptidyl-prolyl cis-trans isomerase [bacterium]
MDVWTDSDSTQCDTRPGGLKMVDIKEGTGPELTAGRTATVHYTGWLTNGKKFDSSKDRGQPFSSRIPGQLIQGWNEGMLGMKVGGVRKLYIPSALGYGSRGAGRDIPPDSDLVFEVELLDVK